MRNLARSADDTLALLTYPNINPVAIEFGPISVKWYGLAYMAGLILGWLYIRRLISTPRLWYGGQATSYARTRR